MTNLDVVGAIDDTAAGPRESASWPVRHHRLPPGFGWGLSSAATAIEGSAEADGRGPSIWDRFATADTISDGSDPRRGADHYRQMENDVRLLADLGVDSYAFSIAWPRVLPDGNGPINIAGIDFYDRLVDALLDAGIEPRPTLYHWDLPQALEDSGGWTNRMIVPAFARYASVVVAQLGDRIDRWTTLHDPAAVAIDGHLTGAHAPGRRRLDDALSAAHHLLLAHGETVRTIREMRPSATVGITLGFRPVAPVGDAPFAHLRQRIIDEWENHWFSDPIGGLDYPPFTREQLGWHRREVSVGDLDLISAPIDFVGVVHRGRRAVGALDGEARPAATTGDRRDDDSLRFLLRRLYETYDFPSYEVFDTVAAPDGDRTPDGRVIDCDRVERFERHLDAIADAIDDGVPVDGYSVEFLDGFAWDAGYGSKCGVFEVDPNTMQRRPKISARWYADLIAGHDPIAD